MKALFVFAHPDDETFFSGGTIAKLAKDGVEVKLITATKGEAGSSGEPPVTTQPMLGSVREEELRNAAKILGISDIYFLGFIDGALDKIPQSKIENAVLEIFQKEKPDVVVTFNKTGLSNHPDHKAISIATTNAFTQYMEKAKKHIRLYYGVMTKTYLNALEKLGLKYEPFGKMTGVGDTAVTTAIDITDVYSIKAKAGKCHKTQHLDWEMFEKVLAKMPSKQEFFQLVLENGM